MDWVARKLYWTDSSKDVIKAANLDTKEVETIVSTGLINPRGIAVHPTRRWRLTSSGSFHFEYLNVKFCMCELKNWKVIKIKDVSEQITSDSEMYLESVVIFFCLRQWYRN